MKRNEMNTLGQIEIDENLLYGIQTIRTMQNMSFSNKPLSLYPDYIKTIATVKLASAKANYLENLLTEEKFNAIQKACKALQNGEYLNQFPIDVFHGGGGIGINMNMNEVLATLANRGLKCTSTQVHPIEDVNLSQSTADVCNTAGRITIYSLAMKLVPKLNLLIEALSFIANKFSTTQTMARTCLQDALPIRFYDFFSGYIELLKRRVTSLEQSLQPLLLISLGGTVIGTGDGASDSYRNTIVEILKKETQLSLERNKNLFDAAQNIDIFIDVSNHLTQLSNAYLKIAKDLRLLSSGPYGGFNEIKLPAVQSGSSFFPGKINPVIPETVIQCSLQVAGIQRSVQGALELAELNLNVFENYALFNIIDQIQLITNVTDIFRTKCIEGIVVNEQRCLELVNSPIPYLTRLKEKIGYSKVNDLLKNYSLEEIKLMNLL
ncbi:aspartate ammonia-lyase [Lysinibacillus sp. PLM2]|nr:aspartate ammonia-lyase [Lysinibacillus sp. PLM2]